MKSIIVKIVILLSLIYMLSLIWKYDYVKVGKEIGNTNNSYALEKNYSEEEVRLNQVKLFIAYLKGEKYQMAYDMLTPDCQKNGFSGDINKFINIVKDQYFDSSKEKKDVFYTTISSMENKGITKTIFSATVYIDELKDVVQFLDKNDHYIQNNFMNITIIETAPFNFQLDVKL